LEALRKFADFQAEQEGSIPFTRSNVFIGLARGKQGGCDEADAQGAEAGCSMAYQAEALLLA
jgi:hypothetical protein